MQDRNYYGEQGKNEAPFWHSQILIKKFVDRLLTRSPLAEQLKLYSDHERSARATRRWKGLEHADIQSLLLRIRV